MLPEPTEPSPVQNDAVEPVATMPEAQIDLEGTSTPPLERTPFWGYADVALVIGLVVALVGAMLVGLGLLMFVRPALKTDPTPILLPSQLGLYLIIYLALKLVFASRYGRPVFSSLGWNRNWTPRLLLAVAVGGLLLSPVVSGIASLLHTPEVKMDILELLDKSPMILALFGVMAVSITPFFEELLFRGFFQPVFCRSLGVAVGIGLTAVLFGVLHGPQYMMQWQYIGAVTLVGATLGVVRYKTGSIIPSTIMHACYNLVAVIALAFKHN